MKKILLYILVLINILLAQDINLISEGFNNGITPPTDWEFSGITSTYTTSGNYGSASPSLKFDTNGDYIITPSLNKPTQLSFWLKGNSTDNNSSLTIFQYINSSYQQLVDIKPLSTTGITLTYNLDTNATKLKFVYNKSAGNLAFDDVLIKGKNNSSPGGGGGTPNLTLSKSKLFLFSYVNSNSNILTYTLSTSNLTSNLNISTSNGIKISTDNGANWYNSLSLTPINGNISSQTIYVMYSPTNIGNSTINIQHSSGSTNQNIVCYCVSGANSNPFMAYKGNYKGKTLRYLLHNVIKNHTVVSYDGLWSQFIYTDALDNGKVYDIYTNNPNGTTSYYFDFSVNQCGTYNSEGDCYNREHSWPKSWFNDLAPAYSDLHHIYPTDGYVNNRRADYAYSNVSNPTYTSSNGSKLGTSNWSGFSGTAFEPNSAFKGDLARSYFYMSTRYIYEDGGWTTSDMTDKAELKSWAANLLLNWHQNDPVSNKEITRNCAIYNIQNNWNPFILEPKFAREIWDTTTAPVLVNAQSINSTQIVVTFDRFVELNSAQNIANYFITGIGNPTSAQRDYDNDPSKVLLTFNNLIPGNTYNIIVNNVTNLNGNPIATNSSISTGNVLPVELKSFSCIKKEFSIIIKWTTTIQLNTEKFIIQKKIDNNWIDLTSIKAKGNSNEIINYEYTDDNPHNGNNTYRLKIIDFDGVINYSDEVHTNFEIKYDFVSNIYPNPFNPKAIISLITPTESFVDINVYDITGKLVKTLAINYPLQTGKNLITFDGNELTSGTYIITFDYKSNTLSKKEYKKAILIK
ncbi:MAG TPA: endonuclease [Ignavibacteriales bacterium]|nr:endonuclease [Ignavibacteriales bacterium]